MSIILKENTPAQKFLFWAKVFTVGSMAYTFMHVSNIVLDKYFP